jgi:hypothetical protein
MGLLRVTRLLTGPWPATQWWKIQVTSQMIRYRVK